MPFSRMLLGILCLAPAVLAAQHGQASTLCSEEDGCEASPEEQVLLLQRQVHLDGQLAQEPALVESWTEDSEVVTDSDGKLTFDAADAFCWEEHNTCNWTNSTSPYVFAKRAVDGNTNTSFTGITSYWLSHQRLMVDTLYLNFAEGRYVSDLRIRWQYCDCQLENTIEISYLALDDGGNWTWRSLTSGGFIVKGDPNPDWWDSNDPSEWLQVNATILGIKMRGTSVGCTSWMCRLWKVAEVEVFDKRSTTTTTTQTIPNNQCPPAAQVHFRRWQLPLTPMRKECSYNGTSAVATIIEVTCGNDCQVSEHLAHALETGPDVNRLPAKIALDIMGRIQEVSEKYFHDAIIEKDLAFSPHVFEQVEDGLASMVGGTALADFSIFLRHHFYPSLIGDHVPFPFFRDRIALWIDDGSNAFLWKAMVASAFDVVAALSGPFAAGASIVTSLFPARGTENKKANHQRIATEMKEKVAKFVDPQAYEEQLASTQHYIQQFTERLGSALVAFQAIYLEQLVDGGMQQYIILNALEAELASTRSQWLLYSQEDQSCTNCNEACATLRKTVPHIVPVLVVMHLAMLQQMALAAAPHNVLAYEVQKKFYQHAFEYYLYMRRLCIGKAMMGTCWLMCGSNEDRIDICCAESGFQQDSELLTAMSSTGTDGLVYRLLELARLGHSRGFINETELEPSPSPSPAPSPSGPPPPFPLLQAGAPSLTGQESELSAGVSPINENGGHSMSHPKERVDRKGSMTMRLAKAGHAFDASPNLQPPRSHWESEYYKICGHGLVCLREEISKEKVDKFNVLALEVSKSLKEQGIMK